MSGLGVILGNYVRRALAYRWLVLVPTVLVFALVTLNTTVQPDTYESFAVLMPPLANPSEGDARETREVASTVFRSATERLVNTKTLMMVAEKLDPYPELRQNKGMLAVVEKLRENIRIEINPHAGTITVTASHSLGHRPAEMASDIVNTLTGIFVKSQREALDDRAAKGEQFLLQQKASYRRELDRARRAVEEFSAAHPGELPDDVELNMEAIDRARVSLMDTRSRQRDHGYEVERLNRELVRLETEFSLARQTGAPAEAAAVKATERLLDSLNIELQQLLFSYSEDHERVLKHKQYIADVKHQLEELKVEAHQGPAVQRERYLQFLMDETRKQIDRHKLEAKDLDAVVASIEKDIGTARDRIQTAAKLEVQYLSLKRDVEDMEERYTAVENRLAEAQYDRKYGEYDSSTPIQVEQSAFVAAKPARPNRLVTSLIGLLIGLGIGVGLAVTRFKLDASYHQADDLRALMPGAVLVTIPEVRTSGVRIGRAILGVSGGLLLAGLFAATVAILGIQVGWWGEPEMIRILTDLR